MRILHRLKSIGLPITFLLLFAVACLPAAGDVPIVDDSGDATPIESGESGDLSGEQPATLPPAVDLPTATAVPANQDDPVTATDEDGIMTIDDRPERLRALTASWGTDWTRHTIDYGEILSGGPPRDGIPSVDNPTFISIAEATDWLAGNEPVLVVEINGDARAYPIQILTWHEIVNDTVGDVPIIATFCPLCNSALVFDRRLDGEAVEFGTSGLLRNSDLIMYDRKTESLWQQFTGEGIVGEKAGAQLTFLPSSLVSFDDFAAAFPEGVVMSRDTGINRSYGRNPYTGYDTVGRMPFLFDGELDTRLAAVDRVVTVSFDDGIDVAYPVTLLAEVGAVNDSPGGHDIVVFHQPGTSSALGAAVIAEGADVGATGVFERNLDGRTLTFRREGGRLLDDQTDSVWNILGHAIDGPLAGSRLVPVVHGDHFWFSWAAFRPDTIIYSLN